MSSDQRHGLAPDGEASNKSNNVLNTQLKYIVYSNKGREKRVIDISSIKVMSIGDFNFGVSGQLNGSNGEATNKDDVDLDRAQVRREAYKYRRRIRHARDPAIGKYRAPKQQQQVPEPVVGESQDGLYLLRSHIGTYVYNIPDKLSAYSFEHSQHVVAVNGLRLVDKPVGPIKVKYCGPGWYVLAENADDNCVLASVDYSTRQYSLPAYRRRAADGAVFDVPARDYIVYEPLYSVIRNKFRSADINTYLLSATLALAASLSVVGYGSGLHPALEGACQYHFDLIHYRQTMVVGSRLVQCKLLNNGESLGHGEDGLLLTLAKYHPVQSYGEAWLEHEDYNCDLPLDWEVRDDFRVVTNKNVRVDGARHLLFDNGEYNARYSTCFFRFVGKHSQPFKTYGRSGVNLTHGLKRLLAARPGETIYRSAALQLGQLFAISDKQLLRSVPVFEMLLGPRAHLLDTDVLPAYRALGFNFDVHQLEAIRGWIVNQQLVLVSRCERSRVEKYVDDLRDVCHWAYNTVFLRYYEFCSAFDMRSAAAEIRHVKRELRRNYVRSELLHEDSNLMVKGLEANIKREMAKFGKAPRLFVSYGAGSMYSPELPEYVKIGVDGEHVLVGNGLTMVINIMAKPCSDSLSKIFTQLYEAMSVDNFVYAAVFSDDMCIAGCINGQKFCWNVDISSNDSSQDMPAFLTLFQCMANFNESRALGLLKQCMLPIKIKNPAGNLDQHVAVQFHGPFEGSGTVLTTCLNHIGSYLILTSFHGFVSVLKATNLPDCMVAAAATIGHVVTIDDCFENGACVFERVQFLKRSPFLHGGCWHPYVNLGCLFRSFGMIEDDLLPNMLSLTSGKFARMPNSSRMDHFFSAVVAGWKNEPRNVIIDALRSRFNTSCEAEVVDKLMHNSVKNILMDHKDLSGLDNTDAICARYGLSDADISELVYYITQLKLGDLVSTSCVDKFYRADYGVK